MLLLEWSFEGKNMKSSWTTMFIFSFFVAKFLSSALGGHPLWPPFFFVQFFVFPWIASPFTCIFLRFWQVCFCSAKGDTPLDPVLLFPSIASLWVFVSFLSLSCWVSVWVRWEFWGNTESTAMLVNINAQAQASAESLPAEFSRVDFHLSHLYPICFPICSRFREASTLQRTEQNFVLASSRLPQYYRLAPLGHNYYNWNIYSPFWME